MLVNPKSIETNLPYSGVIEISGVCIPEFLNHLHYETSIILCIIIYYLQPQIFIWKPMNTMHKVIMCFRMHFQSMIVIVLLKVFFNKNSYFIH